MRQLIKTSHDDQATTGVDISGTIPIAQPSSGGHGSANVSGVPEGYTAFGC